MIKKEIKGLTILRFVAAFYVFLFHAYNMIPANIPVIMRNFFYNGAVGMSFFFILSGFILTYSYNDEIPKGFYTRRIKRIYPLYIFCGLITAPLLFRSDITGIDSILKVLSASLLYATSMQAWLPDLFREWNFGGTWSISVEMFMYLLFPFLANFINNENCKTVWIFSFLAISLPVPLSLLYNSDINFTLYYSSPIYRLPEFMLGISSARIAYSINHIKKECLLVSSLILIVSLFLENKGWLQLSFLTAPCICIIIVSLSKVEVHNKFSLFVSLGRMSYSFYLMQICVMSYVGFFKPPIIMDSGILGWILVFMMTLSLSALTYYLIERRRPGIIL
ncbi:acyltransferase family protein [Pantoea ananatis]